MEDASWIVDHNPERREAVKRKNVSNKAWTMSKTPDRAGDSQQAQSNGIGAGKATPMIQQYLQIKAQHPDAILFYRMGDFYEMFFEDAELSSNILEIALTSRDRDKQGGVPMCGVPHHSASSYIAKLIKRGYKVAICEQVEDPKNAKGLVRREVVRVVTPGLVIDPETLVSEENNYLLGIRRDGDLYGLAVLDISTGEFRVTEIRGERALQSEGERIHPREVILSEEQSDAGGLGRVVSGWMPAMINFRPADDFHTESARASLRSHFGVQSLDGFGCAGMDVGIGAAGAVLQYALETQGGALPHIRSLLPYRIGDHMIMDDWTRRNLELFESLQDRARTGTLLWVLDRTLTPMGARKLKRWLGYPLVDAESINRRLDAVGELVERAEIREALRDRLRNIQDLERLTSRISLGTANARELVGLKVSLSHIPAIRDVLETCEAPHLTELGEKLDPLEDVVKWISETIVDDPPLGTREGGIIREGVDPQLDEWIGISRDGRKYIAGMEAKERQRTGISSMKIGYNRVFGYYIEVTKSHLGAVPPDYVRKQTLVNAERYINEELKEYERKVTEAEERRTALEYEIFLSLRQKVGAEADRIQMTAERVAVLDSLISLAQAAVENRYVRPGVDNGSRITIKEGRHPVVERMGLQERFVPNDLEMDPSETQLIILTGPNMAGKSTYLRQVALIVVMAQAGSFVPASEAHIGCVDRIFTRVGALDNLARGQSTFMVEMNETAQILHQATRRSLVILDEIGRGTSTFDGLSIAWAVAEYLLDHPDRRAKTLFATHYHELTELALSRQSVKNYQIAVKEWNDRIIFLRRVVEGGTSRSYGIQVARLAGLPGEVIERALEILANLEKEELDELGQPRLAFSKKRAKKRGSDARQLNLFASGSHWLLEELRELDIQRITPIEALNLLDRWKQRLS